MTQKLLCLWALHLLLASARLCASAQVVATCGDRDGLGGGPVECGANMIYDQTMHGEFGVREPPLAPVATSAASNILFGPSYPSIELRWNAVRYDGGRGLGGLLRRRGTSIQALA